MKKIYLLFITLLTLSVSAQNELSNGSFENWTSGSPDSWNGSSTNIVASRVSQSTDAQDGAASLNLVNTPNSHKRFSSDIITATNESYTLTYYAKGDGELRSGFYHGGVYGPYDAYTTHNIAEGWTLVTYEFTPNAGDLEVIFSLRNTSTDGILIDNVVLVKTATLSLNSIKEQANFSIYPNPTSLGFVNITSKSNETIQVAVFDILGKQVLSTTVLNNKLHVSTLKSGVYIMNLTQNGKSTTKKLVIK
ncbi:MAG: T9SS type A sorting domain-containing protein [Xanthomarina sp.]